VNLFHLGSEPSHRLDLVSKSDEPGSRLFVGESATLLTVLVVALAIRIYLAMTSYCISGDGVAYLAIARQFADGRWHGALNAVYSPLYPLLISLMHSRFLDWEMTGNLLSVILGTAAVATTYWMTREAFGRRDLALGAAILMALHPETTAYSASVRTEAGYLFLTTGAGWLLLKASNQRRVLIAAVAGITAGLAYLYRTEAIGFLALGIFWLFLSGWVWKRASLAWALTAAGIFAGAFIVVAAPYLAYLRFSTGHWSIGREFAAAMMYGMGDVAHDGDQWRRLGWSATASPLAIILDTPRLYAAKVGWYFLVSFYNFVQALDPLLTVMLAIGIWASKHTLSVGVSSSVGNEGSEPSGSLFGSAPHLVATTKGDPNRNGEILLVAIVLFYFGGFTLSYTGTRFMAHLIPFVFGWVTAGIIVVSEQAAQWFKPSIRRSVFAVGPAIIALTLLPRTLWPIGYDMRGVRYAGDAIARIKKGPAAVAARDGRAAYYAGARLIQLPRTPPAEVCEWLLANHGDFLLIGNHDEHDFNLTPTPHCLKLLKRYPRYRSQYYDLYAVQPIEPVSPSETVGPDRQAP